MRIIFFEWAQIKYNQIYLMGMHFNKVCGRARGQNYCSLYADDSRSNTEGDERILVVWDNRGRRRRGEKEKEGKRERKKLRKKEK